MLLFLLLFVISLFCNTSIKHLKQLQLQQHQLRKFFPAKSHYGLCNLTFLQYPIIGGWALSNTFIIIERGGRR